MKRRQVEIAFELGISPRRLNGWEPKSRTKIIRDPDGRIVELITNRQPEFNAEDRALFHALREYQSDLHTCGRPMSEAFKKAGQPKPDYVVATQICWACMEIEKRRAELAPTFDKASEKDHLNRDAFWSYSVFTRDEAVAIQQAQQQNT